MTWKGSVPDMHTEGMFTKKFHLVHRDAAGVTECTHRVVTSEVDAARLLMHIPKGVEHTDYVLVKERVVDACKSIGKPYYVPDLMRFVAATPEREAHYRLMTREEIAEMEGAVRAAKRARV